MNAVGPADLRRVLKFVRALFQHFTEALEPRLNQARSLAHLQRLRRIHHVVRRQAVMQPARRCGIADRFAHSQRKGNDVVPHACFDLQHARRIHARTFANARRRFPRHDTAFGERVRGGQFDFEPALEAALIGPDRAHLRARIARNHASQEFSRFSDEFANAQLAPEKSGV